MPNQQPHIPSENGLRQFALSPAAVVVFIFNRADELLMLNRPTRPRLWEVVSGALEAEETVLAGALREAEEELGSAVVLRPLGVVHISTFQYDDNAQYMLSLDYVMEYVEGALEAGDDIKGAELKWWKIEEILGSSENFLPPAHKPWMLKRALQLYHLWRDEPVEESDLQPSRIQGREHLEHDDK